MDLDWDIAIKVVTPIITTALAAWTKRAFDARPRLVLYMSHAAAINIPPVQSPLPSVSTVAQGFPPHTDPSASPPPHPVMEVAPPPPPSNVGHSLDSNTLSAAPGFTVHSHGLVIRNVGKQTARNVRISHSVSRTPHQVFPNVKYEISDLPTGGWEILIPTIVPNEQVQISYLYLPPLTVQNFNTAAKSDEAFAQTLNVLPTPQPARWAKAIAYFFVYAGIAATTWVLVGATQWVIALRALLKSVGPG